MNAPMPKPPHSFDPTEDSRALRTALGSFATGVTVITCQTAQGPMGIAANSFASVSLDPPLILWSPAKSSTRYDGFMAAKDFAVHVLNDSQRAACDAFAKSGDAFDMLDWETSAQGVPLLGQYLARFECLTEAQHDAGDHTIIVARVTRVTTRPGKPLIFQGGRYGDVTFAS